jgi:hypothetical protein
MSRLSWFLINAHSKGQGFQPSINIFDLARREHFDSSTLRQYSGQAQGSLPGMNRFTPSQYDNENLNRLIVSPVEGYRIKELGTFSLTYLLTTSNSFKTPPLLPKRKSCYTGFLQAIERMYYSKSVDSSDIPFHQE